VELLETSPARVSAVELQIVQLRQDMSAGFSALRVEIQAVEKAFERTCAPKFGLLARAFEPTSETRFGQVTRRRRRFMRILHEDVIARIAAIRLG
jgi:hypothetical protein